jgi:hypothetical protein
MGSAAAYDDIPSGMVVRWESDGIVSNMKIEENSYAYTVFELAGRVETLLAELPEVSSPTSGEQSDFDEESVLSQLEIKEHKYKGMFSGYMFLVITNNSEYTLEISANGLLKDTAGNSIGAVSGTENAVESGQTVAMYFMNDEVPETADWDISVEEERYYTGVVSNIGYELSQLENKVVITATNNGENPAQFLEAKALFFSGDTLVGHGSTYCVDDDSELKPAKKISKEIDCYEPFDRVDVYFSGRYSD